MKIWNVLGRLALAAALGSALTFPAYAKEKAYPDGIYVGDFSLGGLTKEEAEAGFSEYLAELETRTVTLKVDGAAVKTTAKELGYAAQNEDALKEAEDYAAGGCLIRQYMERKDLEKEPVHISLDAQIDEGTWTQPPIIDFAVEKAGLSREEALKTFNCGIGMCVICPPEVERAAIDQLESTGEKVFKIGTIIPGDGKVVYRG